MLFPLRDSHAREYETQRYRARHSESDNIRTANPNTAKHYVLLVIREHLKWNQSNYCSG